jgi:hypothetical protein
LAESAFLIVAGGALLAVGWLIAHSNFAGKLAGKRQIPGEALHLALDRGREVVQVFAYASFEGAACGARVSEFTVSCRQGESEIWRADLRVADSGSSGLRHEIVPVHEFRPPCAGEYIFQAQPGARQEIRFEELTLQVRIGKSRSRRWVYLGLLAAGFVAVAGLALWMRRGP